MTPPSPAPRRPTFRALPVFALLLVWFVVAAVIGGMGLLVNSDNGLLPPIAMTAVVPVVLFLLAYALSDRFRGRVLALDVRTLTMLQHWRVIGFAFLPLAYHEVLPRLFAWPAGLGDLAIGLAAPFVMARLARTPEPHTSPTLLGYHMLGLLDFAVAILTAGLSAGAFPALVPGGVTSAAMDVWPLNLFPSFIVPLFVILHLSVLLQVRHRRRRMRPGTDSLVPEPGA